MSQSRKQQTRNTDAEHPVNPRRKAEDSGVNSQAGSDKKDGGNQGKPPSGPGRKRGDNRRRRTAIILAAVVIILILAIVGIIGYPTYVAPFRRTIISVDDTNIRMDYFIKRIKLTGSDPISLLTELTNDQIIKLGAPKISITVTPEDIDQTLRSVFQGQSDNVSETASISEPDFKEWYRQLLNESELSDAEYRDIISIEIYRSRLQEHLVNIMPTTAEHSHVYLISVETQKEAENVRARWAAGEKFTDLAKELSLDTTTGANGGEVGWFPQGGILTPQLENAVFELSTGNVSEPVAVIADQQQEDGTTAPTIVGYHVVMVTEREIRELDANALRVFQGKVVDGWLSAERSKYNIAWHGLSNGFDSETYAWINYQVAKSKPASTGQ